MHYLIDGYNLLFRLIVSKKPLQSQRQTVIRSLQKEFALLHLEGTLIFDGSHTRGEQSGLSYKSPLVIAYSHRGETADHYILEKVEFSSSPSLITVVTDDRSLASASRNLGAHTLSLMTFLALLKRKHAKKKMKREEAHDQSPFYESKKDLDRLLKIFETRLENGD